jgi:hypothetical protein
MRLRMCVPPFRHYTNLFTQLRGPYLIFRLDVRELLHTTSTSGTCTTCPSSEYDQWTGWKDILWLTYGQIGEDRLLAVAAGVVFYGLLALFPAVTAFVSLYGFFAGSFLLKT